MRCSARGFVVSFALMASAVAQSVVIPGNPGKFKSRSTGGSASCGVEVSPGNAGTSVRHVTYLVLSVSRLWTSTDQKLIEGKLIAFEDLVTEGAAGSNPPPPTPPAEPTVVRGEKIRLLIHQKPVEVALSRLSEADREFVESVRKAYQKKTPPAP